MKNEGILYVFLVFQTEEVGSKAGRADASAASIQGLRLLLAEDNELNAEIAQTLLTDAEATIAVIRDGRRAVDLFTRSPAGTFDAILIDVMMPVMDGLTADRTIRTLSRPDAGTIPIIAMTANAFAADAQKCLDAGMNAHPAKPLNIPKVIATIARLCEKPQNPSRE